jgi:hypothetical protein
LTGLLKILKTCLSLTLCFIATGINAQILKDTASLNIIKNGVDYIYNFQFNEAGEVYGKLNLSYPEHPVVYLFKGMTLFWEDYPLLPLSPSRVSFEETMLSCIELCESPHDPGDEPEYLLANLCARGMLLWYYNANDLTSEVIPLARTTYPLVRRSFDYTSFFPDFLYFTGLYNYYREAYPDAYPVYKPLALFFPKGDREKGLTDLQTAAISSIELKAESYALLSWICIGFENNYQQALYYSKSLHELYPANSQYMADYIKNLLLAEQFEEAERQIISTSEKINNSYFQAQFDILNGILTEKKYSNYKLAQQYYTEGSTNISLFGSFGNEYAAYAYFGLSRISGINGDKYNKKMYREKALHLAKFKKVDFDE